MDGSCSNNLAWLWRFALSTRLDARAKTRGQQSAPVNTDASRPANTSFRPALGWSLLGGILLWAAFPPLNLWPLAWLAPWPWLYLVLRPQPTTRMSYVGIWLGSFVHWLLMLQGIRLAHWGLYGGWILLAAYLAVYLPLFVGLCRVALRLKVSTVLAAPVVWVGFELARGYVVTGFSAGLLSHSQTDWPALLQISDTVGAYGVSFVMMLAAACGARIIFSRPRVWWPLIPGALAVGVTVAYGLMRLAQQPPGSESPPLQVALIQGSRDVHIDMTPANAFERMQHYSDLTIAARAQSPQLDLVIWPESMFAIPRIVVPTGVTVPTEEREAADHYRREFPKAVRQAAQMLNPPDSSAAKTPTQFYFCTSVLEYGSRGRKNFNSALLASEEGEITSRYDKTHAVMFGEYVPFGAWFPAIYDWIPIEPMSEGDQPGIATVKDFRLSPNICFESTVPHLIRSQVLELVRDGTPPDVLVNLTNDGWFYGSSILDLHLKCSVFRAIENRRPVLIAANTGISAHIDGQGRILLRGPRREAQVLVASVRPDGRSPLYHTIGDLPAWGCLVASLILLMAGLVLRRCDSAGSSGIARTPAHESEQGTLGPRMSSK